MNSSYLVSLAKGILGIVNNFIIWYHLYFSKIAMQFPSFIHLNIMYPPNVAYPIDEYGTISAVPIYQTLKVLTRKYKPSLASCL